MRHFRSTDHGGCYRFLLQQPGKCEVENWLARFGLYPNTHTHALGHLNYDEIKDVVQTVQPKVLIPVHTRHPEVFQNLHDDVILPEKGVAVNI